MNPNHPSPEDPTDIELQHASDVERELKRLQPRANQLDAKVLLHLAENSDDSREFAERTEREVESFPPTTRREQQSRWVTIAGTWICGAVVGAVLTFIIVSQESPVAIQPEQVTTPSQLPPQITAIGPEVDSDVNPSAGIETDLDDKSPFSPQSELFVSTQLLDPFGDAAAPFITWPPLRAGDFVRLREPTWQSPAEHLTNRATELTESSSSGASPPREGSAVPPTRSRNQNQLLQELLGAHPDSLL